jgi:alanine racemase
MFRPAKAFIDLVALQHNCREIKKYTPTSQLIAVLKANAYGHGAMMVGKALENLVDMVAVSCLEEAVELRSAQVELPIILLEGCFSSDELIAASQQNFHVVVHCDEQLESLEQTSVPQALHVWLKVDTGMHRLGIEPSKVGEFQSRLIACDSVADNVRLMSHFASADVSDNPLNDKQLVRFNESRQNVSVYTQCSMANSAAILSFPEAHFDWVRPGILLFGVSPFKGKYHEGNLKPVMTLASRVISVSTIEAGETVGYGNRWLASRQSKIATVAIGYGDGYPRSAKDGTPVMVNDTRVPLVGAVSMDMLTVDVTDIDPVAVGDEVELWGKSLSVNEVASYADTIGYELLTRMPARVERTLM